MKFLKLRLVESLSDSIKQSFQQAAEESISELKALAQEINQGSAEADEQHANLENLKQLAMVTAATATGKNWVTVAHDKIAECYKTFEQLVKSGKFSSDQAVNVKANDLYNSFKALMSVQLDKSSYQSLQRILDDIISCCIKGDIDTKQTSGRSLINAAGYIIQNAQQAVNADDLKLTDQTVTAFTREMQSLSKALSAQSEEQALTACKKFIDSWTGKIAFSEKTRDMSKTGAPDSEVTKIQNLADSGLDWEKEMAKASSYVVKNDLWDKFLQSFFGKNANWAKNLGTNLQKLCNSYGYTTKSNPYLYFLKYTVLGGNVTDEKPALGSPRVNLTAMSFWCIAHAVEQRELFKEDLESKTPLNLIQCRQFYNQKSDVMTYLLRVQANLAEQNRYKVTEQLLKDGRITIDQSLAVGDTLNLSVTQLAEVFYINSTAGTVSSRDLSLRSIRDIRDLAAMINPKILSEIQNKSIIDATVLPKKIRQDVINPFGNAVFGPSYSKEPTKEFVSWLLVMLHYARTIAGSSSDKQTKAWAELAKFVAHDNEYTTRYVLGLPGEQFRAKYKTELDQSYQNLINLGDNMLLALNKVKAYLLTADSKLANLAADEKEKRK